MKQFLNFKVIMSLGLFIGMSVVAQAQSSFAAADARATVVQQIAVTHFSDLEFGLVTPGTPKTITTSGANLVTGGAATGGETRGVFIVSAGIGTNVTLSYDYPAALESGASTLPIVFQSAWGEVNDNSASFPVTMSTDTNIAAFPDNDISGSNQIFVMLGGTVTPAVGQSPGLYEEVVTLTAEYN